ncbi:MAG: outer membrane protein assembly factor BamA [Candidatus Krumholzibacteria bacterium]|nr:outer membrane protein assembly factor BamA [Candidatus Krumholzibacteria bacterium]
MKISKLASRGRFPCAQRAGFLYAALALSIAATFAVPAAVQAADQYIASIVVEGNEQVSADKIRRVIRLGRGDPYDRVKFQEALKRLFATKQFRYIQAYKDDVSSADSITVIVSVREYPKVEEVRYEGNKHVDHDDLEKVVGIGKGTFVRPSLLGKDRDAIADVYKEKGYYRVEVGDTISVDPELRARVLIYQIDEGEKVSVKHIDFIGVRALDTDEIRGMMKTKEDSWFRGGDFKPREFEEDQAEILRLYRGRGFLDARIVDKELVFSENGKDLDIFVTVEEGKRYEVGKVTWSGNELFPDTLISQMITMYEGEVFDDSEFARIRDDISSIYADRGYIYSTISPVKSVQGQVIDVEFEITEGKPAHIREINIEGNTKTYEQVIRRQLVITPGDVFLRSRLIRSLREVFNLGFFAGPPQVIPGRPDEETGDLDITLRVEEKPAGQFRLGAGFSQLNRVSGFIGVQEPNFLGRGLRIGFDWEFARTRQNINVSLTDPWFMGTPTEVSVNVYNRVQNQVQQQFFSDRRTGISFRVGRPFPWFDYTTMFVRYSWERVDLSNFSPGYRGPLLSTPWPQRTGTVALTLMRNSTDNPFHPTMGTRTVLTGRWTGGELLGGDIHFQSYDIDFRFYEPLFWRFVLEVRNQFGVLDGYQSPEQVPDYEKYRLGGNRRWGVRGYDFYEIVPRGNTIFVGGRFMQISTVQVNFPIAGPTVYGLFFADGGNTWNSFQGASLFDLRKGVGFGVRIELPMLGTVGLDYGYGIDRVGGAAWEPHITFGGMF